jgi:hypothetical protein
MNPTTDLKKHLSKLFEKSLRISSPLSQLEIIRQKLETRSLQPFDKSDILSELGSIQQTMRELNSEMLRIHDLLKQQ